MTKLALALALAGCGDLQGFGGPVPPLATFQVQLDGDPAVAGESLHVALVWGMQWLPEALCTGLLPPESQQAADTLAAGCRDPFGFVPLRVEANVAVQPGVPATMQLFTLPGADVMVGDVTARVAYASFVAFDDRDATGRLELARPNRLGNPTMQPPTDTTPTTLNDVVHGASFLSMTQPDVRMAFREGAFLAAAAFYPRAGCADPPPTFSVLGAGGFSAQDALAATIAGKLPPEDPASCTEAAPEDTIVHVALRTPDEAHEAACTENNADSSVRYREPPLDTPDFTDRQLACVHLPTFDGTTSPVIELIVSGRTTDACKGLTHYVLAGCRSDPNCATPQWDHSLAPPTWWPCPTS